MEDGANIGKRLARSGARCDDEIFTGRAETNRFNLVMVELVSFEDVTDVRVQSACVNKGVQTAEHFERGIELEKGRGPELSLS